MRAPFRFRWRPWLAAALLCLPAAWSQAQSSASLARSLPNLGDGAEMALGEERRIGDQIARAIYRDPDHLDDAQLSDYLEGIWQPLLAAAQARGDLPPDASQRYAWTLLLIRDPSVNAFALPGGYLGVHLGLIANVANADELASVLAHELSHVSQRHIARLLSQQSRQAPWMIASMVLGALAASKARNADIGSAAIVGGQAMMLQNQLNFSRDMEREADRVGFGVMTEAGFDGSGFATMFDKLQQASRLNDDGGFPYLRSHPLTTERMADMRNRLALAGPHAGAAGQPVSSPGLHAMMAARARVLADTRIDRLRALAQAGRSSAAPLRDPATLALRYAGVLAAARLHEPALAQEQLARLLAAQPEGAAERQAVRLLALEAMLLTQADRLAGLELAALRTEALARPERAALLLGARAAAAGTDAALLDSASQRLQTWLALNPGDAPAWQTLATLAQLQGQPVRAARAAAEVQRAQLDLQGALDRMKSAQSLARQSRSGDHAELSIIDARTHELEGQLREQFCEERERRDAACQQPR
ncbi:MAG: repeat-containing protein YfgC precursor [Pseudomonadota bacterium]|jgi:predicted Zn-dependent protease